MSPATIPPLPPTSESTAARSFLAAVLSVILAAFLGCAAVSLVTDSLSLILRGVDLSAFDMITLLVLLLISVLTFVLLAFFPAIPKRFFLLVSLFLPVVGIGVFPLLVYFYKHIQWISWGISLAQLCLGLFILRRVRGEWKPGWPLVPAGQLADRGFGWGNLAGVVLGGALVILPALLIYTAFSATLAVDHFTDGFLALRTSGLTVQVRSYVRDSDGKEIMLVPMSHVGESKFYKSLAASFPTDSVILMEGVSDSGHVLPKKISYARMAASVGAVEQAEVFQPPGEIVSADVDVSSFSPGTLDFLKSVLLIHVKGVTAETLPALLKPMAPDLQQQVMDDLLTKRNRHLLGVLQERLADANHIIVPWGAAHMPELAREIRKLGFHQVNQRRYVAIRFGS